MPGKTKLGTSTILLFLKYVLAGNFGRIKLNTWLSDIKKRGLPFHFVGGGHKNITKHLSFSLSQLILNVLIVVTPTP